MNCLKPSRKGNSNTLGVSSGLKTYVPTFLKEESMESVDVGDQEGSGYMI